MQIQCPNCGEKIRAENINIQDKIAVCSACDTVFKFEIPEEKIKRRKVKQPQNLILRDSDESLKMSFRTNFRLDADEGFVGSIIMGLMGAIIGPLMINGFLGGKIPFLIPMAFIVISLIAFYNMALIAYNQTEIEMNDERIRLSRKPLPTIFGNPNQEVQVSGVVSFVAEESPKSVKEAYDTPRYHVWAIMQDGSRKIVVPDLIEDYAHFVAQRFEERLHSEEGFDSSRLEDAETLSDEVLDSGALTTKKQTMNNQ
jgi:uncharacterized membrane protein YeaQ/YmgE (transglycosylase-associated protein family)